MKTYLQAQKEILTKLEAQGWRISSKRTKICHATHPTGLLKLWFMPRAVHYMTGRVPLDQKMKVDSWHCRVIHGLDIRKVDPVDFCEWVKFLAGHDGGLVWSAAAKHTKPVDLMPEVEDVK